MASHNIPSKVAESLVNALNAGTTPRRGLEYITVGREKEISVLLHDLEQAKSGGGSFKFIVGEYGSGKSFMLQAIRNYALEKNFVVMDVDLGPDKRLRGTGNRGLATYRTLMANMAVKSKPLGGALDLVLSRWLSNLRNEVENTEKLTDTMLQKKVNSLINDAVLRMQSMVYEYDFIKVMELYWNGMMNGKEEDCRNAARWFRGEYDGKRDAKSEIGVSNIIQDDNWYNFIKIWAEFVSSIGYSGLVVFFDEAKTLANIASVMGRNANYESLLAIFNDTLQGHASHLSILVGATNEFIKDERRGLFSYNALRTRLEDGKYAERNGMRNWDAPLMPLKVLSHEEIFVLMQKLREVHGVRYNYTPRITDDNLEKLLQETVNRVGADDNLTAREVTRNFMNILGLLYHNPDGDFETVMKENVGNPLKEISEDFLLDE